MQLDLPFLRFPSPETPPSEIGIEFVRVPRARRYVIRVGPDGRLRVTLPRRGSKREALAFVETQRRWIERERARVLAGQGPREWDDGSTILLEGRPVVIGIETGTTGRAA